jgi:hypothetical protein
LGTRIVKIRVGDLAVEQRQLLFLKARCEQTGLDFPAFLCGLIDREQDEFRKFLFGLIKQDENECLSTGWKPSPASLPLRPKEETIKIKARSSRRKLSSEDEDRIVICKLAEGMKAPLVAERFNTSPSTVFRIWKRRTPSAEKIQQVLFLAGKTGQEHIAVEAVAKTCGVSRIVAEGIIQNHKPMVPSAGTVYARPPKPGGWKRHVEAV